MYCLPSEFSGHAANDVLEVLALPLDQITAEHQTMFIVEAVLEGHLIRLLVDTGASISFVADHWLKAVNISNDKLVATESDMVVRLGDASTSPVNRVLEQAEFVLAGFSTETDFHVLALPTGFDAVLGLDYMDKYQVVLDVANKALHLRNGTTRYTSSGQSLASYLDPGGNNHRLNVSHYIRAGNGDIEVPPSTAECSAYDANAEKSEHSANDSDVSSDEDEELVPGIYQVQDSLNEIEFVDSSTYRQLCVLYDKGTLDWNTYS